MTVLVFCFSVIMTIAGVGLVGLSVFLSVDVFSGIGSDSTYSNIFGSMAFAFEMIKFSLVPIAMYFYRAGNSFLSGSLALTFVLLTFLSIFASVSSLNQNNSEHEAEFSKAISEIAEKDAEIAQLEVEIIQLNNQINVFIEAEKVTLKADPKTAIRDKKKLELQKLKDEKKLITIPERTAMAKGAEAIGREMGLESDTAATWVNMISSLLIDFLAAVGILIGEILFNTRLASKSSHEEKAEQRKADERELQRKHERELARLNNLSASPKEEPVPAATAPVSISRTTPTLVASSPEITSTGGDQDVDAARLKEVKTLVAQGELPDPPNARQIAQKIGANSAEARKLEGYLKRG